jgi:hypothetical protein
VPACELTGEGLGLGDGEDATEGLGEGLHTEKVSIIHMQPADRKSSVSQHITSKAGAV